MNVEKKSLDRLPEVLTPEKIIWVEMRETTQTAINFRPTYRNLALQPGLFPMYMPEVFTMSSYNDLVVLLTMESNTARTYAGSQRPLHC
jgi:hypothetical protein